MELKVYKVRPVYKALKALLGLKEHKVLPVYKVHKV